MKPRSTRALLGDTVRLYRRFPLLFLALAAGVIVPYDLIVLAATGTDQSGRSSLGVTAEIVLAPVVLFVANPLVSALHVNAVSDVRDDEEPRLVPIAGRGLAALPVVSAAAIMSTLGIGVGLLLFVVPGIYLWVRWFLVAQAAAVEREGWTAALSRSRSLTEGQMWHVFGFMICILLIGAVPSLLLGLAFVDQPTTALSFLSGTVLSVLLVSFTALATALLYYDLRTQRELLAVASRGGEGPAEPADPTASRGPQSLDPRRYSDADRPKGWYVDPSSPSRMRYWAGEPTGWTGRARTPGKLRRRWDEENG